MSRKSVKTSELLPTLSQQYPNGISFDPMSLRLLRKKISIEDWQIEELKEVMFQLENGLWFSCEMVSDEKTRLAIRDQGVKWLREHGCFSVNQLFEKYFKIHCQLNTPEKFAALLRNLGFWVAKWAKSGLFCFRPQNSLNECLIVASKEILKLLEAGHGTLAFSEIEASMPHLNAAALENIRVQFLPEYQSTELGGVLCWCSAEAIHLQEDFQERLEIIVDTLVDLNEHLSVAKLEFSLNLFYRTHFRKEYALKDDDTFMRICIKHYQGKNDFSNLANARSKQKKISGADKRTRRPNTRFDNLGVPVGANLVFVNDSLVACRVLDGVNQVEYDGKPWSISALAVHLMDGATVNGFSYFSYEGETLWDRRSRMERENKRG